MRSYPWEPAPPPGSRRNRECWRGRRMASPKDQPSTRSATSVPNLAAIVVEKGWATAEQVQAAARKAKAEKLTLSRAFIALGILTEVQIRRALGGPKAASDHPRVLDPSLIKMI